MSYASFLRANSRWLAAGFLLTTFSGFGQTFYISLSSGHLREEFDLSHGDFGLLYMMATLCSAVCLPWVGRSVDAFPVQRVAAVVMLSLGGFCVAMANVSSVWMLFFVIFGLRLCGQGMMTHTSVTAMARWFSAQRGRAISLASMGFPFAESIFPSFFVLITAQLGWRSSWWAAAALVLVFALPVVWVLLRRERQPQSTDTDGEKPQGRQWTRREVLGDPVFWMISAGVLAPPFIGTAILFNQIYLVNLRGWTLELFASAFVVMAMVAILASLTLGVLIDRYTARRLLPFMLVPLTLACLVLAAIEQSYAAFVFMALLGVSSAFTATLGGALWPELYGTRHIGAIRSVAFAMMVFASAAGPGLIGVLIDLQVSYDIQLLGMGGYCALVTGLLFLASRFAERRG